MAITNIISRLWFLFFIAWRNLWRNRIRSLLTISALGGGLALMIYYVAFTEGMFRQMTEYATGLSMGHIQIHHQSFDEDQDLYGVIPWELVSRLQQHNPSIKVAPRMYAAGLASAGNQSTGAILRGIDPEHEAEVTTLLTHARKGKVNFNPIESLDEEDLPMHRVAIGYQLSRNLEANVGDELILITQAADGSIGNALYEISAIMQPVDPAFDRMGVMMSIQALQELVYLENGAHEIAIRIDDTIKLVERKNEIRQVIDSYTDIPLDPESGKLLVRTWKELIPEISDMLEVSTSVVYIIGAILVGLAALGMMNTMLMAIHERSHEFGILLCIGMGKYWLLTMVMIEAFFLSLISAVVGMAVGIGFSWHLENYGIDMSGMIPDGFDFGGIVFSPVWKGYLTYDMVTTSTMLMLFIAMSASLIPSWRTVRMKPVEVLR